MLERGVEAGRIDPALLDYDLDRLAAAARPDADLDFDFLGLQTLYDRYLIIDKTGGEPRRIEAPQLFWMRVAMGVCLAEEPQEREERALELYGCTRSGASAPRPRRCSTPARLTRSSRAATCT